jgi:hypothetical protein
VCSGLPLMNILSLFSFGSRDQIFNLQISINGLVLWFQGFHSIHHLPLQAENSPDNYSWLHTRFIGERRKPTLSGCGWRQGSLTLSFMCYFFYDWAYDYDCHVPFGYVSPSDHPLQFYKNVLSQTCERYT